MTGLFEKGRLFLKMNGFFEKGRLFLKGIKMVKKSNSQVKKKSLTRRSLKMYAEENYEIPYEEAEKIYRRNKQKQTPFRFDDSSRMVLSRKMSSKYRRDEQKPEWYNDNRIAILVLYEKYAAEISKECKRRNIEHFYHDHVQISPTGGLLECYMVKIQETGLKVQQLVDWAILKFNTEEMLKTDWGFNMVNVWIEVLEEKKK